MEIIKSGTKEAQAIISRFLDKKWSNKGATIYHAYGKPSYNKIQAWENIQHRALNTEGYNKDLRVTGATCYFFSTIYSYTTEEGTFIVQDTPGHTKVTKLEEN